MTLQDLKKASASLPDVDRAELAQFLLQSLDEEQADWASEWQKELAERLAAIRAGQVVGVPASEVVRKLRARYP